jgi:hypothetical protein
MTKAVRSVRSLGFCNRMAHAASRAAIGDPLEADWPQAAQDLAGADPASARRNAENYRYFIRDTAP